MGIEGERKREHSGEGEERVIERWVQWLMSIILATLEAEIRKIMV
jgi:hypothetical protein